MYAKPGSAQLVLQNRKGFIKWKLIFLIFSDWLSKQELLSFLFILSVIFIKINFEGENELYEQVDNPEGTQLRTFQDWMKNKFGFTFPIFNGNFSQFF